MARTALTPQETLGSFPGLPLSANAADFTWAAADATDGNSVVLTGNELILVRNDSGVQAETITIDSVPHPTVNREGDITDYSVGDGEYAVFGFFRPNGWKQSDGTLHIDVSSADLKIAVLRVKN